MERSPTHISCIFWTGKGTTMYKILQKWGRNGRTGATSLSATGKCMRTYTKQNLFWSDVDSELSLFYIYKKWSITCKTPNMALGQTFDINSNTNTQNTHLSPHLQNTFYPARVCARHLFGWYYATRYENPQSVYVCKYSIVRSVLTQRTLFSSEICICSFLHFEVKYIH